MEAVNQSSPSRRISSHASTSFDLAVVGGGPAGTSAAITAAHDGARVLLLERGSLPRQRVCGEFVSSESLSLLEGLLNSAEPGLLDQARKIPQARLFFDGHSVSTSIDPPAASIARFDLDYALWRAATSAGVSARFETSVEGIEGREPFVLRAAGEEFQARAIINASGRWSNLRAQRGNLPDGNRFLGLKAHYAEGFPNPSVDLYFFDGGYCGVQPVALADSAEPEGRVNVCAMVRSDVARSLPEVFQQNHELQARAREWQLLTDPVTTSPLLFGTPEPLDNEILLVGDAAGFVDPFVGDGISLALRSGALAAECLAPFFRAECSLAQAGRQYQRLYRERLLPVFRSSSQLRRLLRLPRPLRRSIAYLLEATPAMSQLLVRLTR